MELETKTILLPVDANYDAELQKLKAEGWVMRPDVEQTFHLIRVKPESLKGSLGLGEMKIDEGKVFVMDKDGVIRKQ
jgi:hypothetical protein